MTNDNDLAEPLTRIVCAAIRKHVCGTVICSARHYDKVMRATILRIYETSEPDDRQKLASDAGWYSCQQGFLTNVGEFLTRSEAWHVAKAAGQIRKVTGTEGTLYSEDLY